MPFITPEKMHLVPRQPVPDRRLPAQAPVKSSRSRAAGQRYGKHAGGCFQAADPVQDFIGGLAAEGVKVF